MKWDLFVSFIVNGWVVWFAVSDYLYLKVPSDMEIEVAASDFFLCEFVGMWYWILVQVFTVLIKMFLKSGIPDTAGQSGSRIDSQ